MTDAPARTRRADVRPADTRRDDPARERPAARLLRRRRRAVPAGAGPQSRRRRRSSTPCRSRVAPGELVAIVGPSGAGKTTLLEAIAGIAPTSSGSVRFDGIDLHANLRKFRGVIGYVPQDDIIHADLPLRHTLRYAARLRLPSSTTAAEVDDAVRAAIDTVGLDRAGRRPGRLAERRAAQARQHRRRAAHRTARLLPRRADVRPRPGHERGARSPTCAQLADRSATVVFTTHSVEDLARCDRIVFMARGGRVGFVGTVDEALEHFGVGSVPELYRRPGRRGRHRRRTPRRDEPPAPPPTRSPRREQATRGERVHAMGVSSPAGRSRRSCATRLTLAILLASPALVVGMFAVLFRPGAFDFRNPSPSSMVMIGFWVVFAAFFFGLTYGLLQICTERTIVRRERLVGLRLGAYVASKVTVLVPFLLVVIVAMLGVLRLLDRLPRSLRSRPTRR